MAVKPETNFIAQLHKRLPKEVYRMKNHNPYTGGVPDCWYSGKGGDLWVEYKWLPVIPKNANIRPKALLSPLQSAWLDGRHEEERSVCVIIGCPEGGVILNDLQWSQEITPQDFKSKLLSKDAIARWISERTSYSRSRLASLGC